MVGGWLVGGSVVLGFNETQEKTCLESGFHLCNLIEVYFDLLFSFSSILTIKKK